MQLSAIFLYAVRVGEMRLAAGDDVRFRCVYSHKFPRFLEEHAVAGARCDPVQTIARSRDP